eukprot:401768-Rhodomonas_salina.3
MPHPHPLVLHRACQLRIFRRLRAPPLHPPSRRHWILHHRNTSLLTKVSSSNGSPWSPMHAAAPSQAVRSPARRAKCRGFQRGLSTHTQRYRSTPNTVMCSGSFGSWPLSGARPGERL